ncbi:hypothetical protein DPMN_057254 [Dreissena polymorpha]|uniref:Uncharacterized protein n=1 Tax=Dreissena polymorpha TaxID=45954 RepID=A0A9D4HU84_DREPO|nr:hypothetical protein DPMN_057254 [Dreissena polymorpha]
MTPIDFQVTRSKVKVTWDGDYKRLVKPVLAILVPFFDKVAPRYLKLVTGDVCAGESVGDIIDFPAGATYEFNVISESQVSDRSDGD